MATAEITLKGKQVELVRVALAIAARDLRSAVPAFVRDSDADRAERQAAAMDKLRGDLPS